jgi:cell division septal protein FtsQ
MARPQATLLKQQKIVKRKKILRIVKAIGAVIVLAGLVYGLSVVSKRPEFAIQNIIIEGNVTLATDAVVALAQQKLAGNYGFIFSRANIVFFPKQEIIKTVSAQTLRIKTVTIERLLWNSIAIKITERMPIGVWCGVEMNTTEPCYLMDAEGFIFDTAPQFSGSAYTRFFGPIKGNGVLGSEITPHPSFIQTTQFVDALPNIGLDGVSIVMKEKDYSVYLKSGTEIRLTYTDPIDRTISTLKSILEQRQFMSGGIANAEYIDLRYGNKIFYKFKGKDLATSTQE